MNDTEKASPLFGPVGTHWIADCTWSQQGRPLRTARVSLIVQPGIVCRGGGCREPGVQLVLDEAAVQLTALEREWLVYLLNDGALLECATEPEDPAAVVLSFRAQRCPA